MENFQFGLEQPASGTQTQALFDDAYHPYRARGTSSDSTAGIISDTPVFGTGDDLSQNYFRLMQARPIVIQIYGNDSLQLAQLEKHLGDNRKQLGHTTDAAEHFRAGLTILQGIYGKDSPQTVACLKELAKINETSQLSSDKSDAKEKHAQAAKIEHFDKLQKTLMQGIVGYGSAAPANNALNELIELHKLKTNSQQSQSELEQLKKIDLFELDQETKYRKGLILTKALFGEHSEETLLLHIRLANELRNSPAEALNEIREAQQIIHSTGKRSLNQLPDCILTEAKMLRAIGFADEANQKTSTANLLKERESALTQLFQGGLLADPMGRNTFKSYLNLARFENESGTTFQAASYFSAAINVGMYIANRHVTVENWTQVIDAMQEYVKHLDKTERSDEAEQWREQVKIWTEAKEDHFGKNNKKR